MPYNHYYCYVKPLQARNVKCMSIRTSKTMTTSKIVVYETSNTIKVNYSTHLFFSYYSSRKYHFDCKHWDIVSRNLVHQAERFIPADWKQTFLGGLFWKDRVCFRSCLLPFLRLTKLCLNHHISVSYWHC